MTLAQVAKRANVAIMTASKVFNGNPRVRPYIKERVLKAAEELNYKPNTLARGLRSKSSNIVTLGVHETDNPYFGKLVGDLSKVLLKDGKAGVICHNSGLVKEVNQVSCACGTILLSPSRETIEYLTGNDHPLVTVTATEPLPDLAPDISIDFEYGYELIGAELIKMKSTNIVYFAPLHDFHINYELKFKYLESYLSENLDEYDSKTQTCIKEMDEMIAYYKENSDAIDTICTTNDIVGAKLIIALQNAGIDVGNEVTIVGCDGTFNVPSMISLYADTEKLAQTAFGTLSNHMTGDKSAKSIYIKPELVL